MNSKPRKTKNKPLELSDTLIDSLVEICNHKNFIKNCEPNICFPQDIKAFQVKRVLMACDLLYREWNKKEVKE